MRSSSPSVSTRGPPGAGTALWTPPSREGADDRVGELGLERRDLPAQLTARGAFVGDAADVADVEHAARVYRAPRASESASTQPNRASSTCSAGTPGTATAKSRRRALSRAGRRLGATRRRAPPPGRAASATTTRPGTRSAAYSPSPSRSPARAPRSPSGPSSRGVVERPHRDAGLDERDEQGVLQRPARGEAALHQALERRGLDRRALRVGIEADVAEEDAVGVRDRLAAQRQRAGAVEAVGQQRQALAQRARRAPPGRRRDDRDQPQLGELERELAVDPALLERRVRAVTAPSSRAPRARARRSARSSPASSSSPTLVACTTPPGSA